MATAVDVVKFLGAENVELDAAVTAVASITMMVRAYTRGQGFLVTGEPKPELDAVIVAAAARLASNPAQVGYSTGEGPFSMSVGNGFSGFNLAELSVLNRYRRRAW